MCAGIRRIGSPGKTTEAMDSAASSTRGPGARAVAPSGRAGDDGEDLALRAAHLLDLPGEAHGGDADAGEPVDGERGVEAPRHRRYATVRRPGRVAPTAVPGETTAVVWVSQDASLSSAVPSPMMREASRTVPSWWTTWSSRGVVTATGTLRVTSAGRGARLPSAAAVKKVLSSTAAGMISTPWHGVVARVGAARLVEVGLPQPGRGAAVDGRSGRRAGCGSPRRAGCRRRRSPAGVVPVAAGAARRCAAGRRGGPRVRPGPVERRRRGSAGRARLASRVSRLGLVAAQAVRDDGVLDAERRPAISPIECATTGCAGDLEEGAVAVLGGGGARPG